MISVVWGARDLRGLHDKKKKGNCKLQFEVGVGGDAGGGKIKLQQNLPDTITATFA